MSAMVTSEPTGSTVPALTAEAPAAADSGRYAVRVATVATVGAEARPEDADCAVRVAELLEEDWRLWRDLRLEALADAPHAFGGTLAQAQACTEEEWRSWWHDLEKGTVGPRFVAFADGEPAAMSSICFPDDHGNEPLLISMWASPKARGRGLARRMLDACVGYCARTGRSRLLLGVVDDNLPAVRLYERYGFTPTGHSEPLHSDPSKLVLWMELPVPATVTEA